MPREAPVTSAVFPVRVSMIIVLVVAAADNVTAFDSSYASALVRRTPVPQERDGERGHCQQDDADAVEVCGARQTNNGCEEACRECGKAEGKIAHDEIGRQQASA